MTQRTCKSFAFALFVSVEFGFEFSSVGSGGVGSFVGEGIGIVVGVVGDLVGSGVSTVI